MFPQLSRDLPPVVKRFSLRSVKSIPSSDDSILPVPCEATFAISNFLERMPDVYAVTCQVISYSGFVYFPEETFSPLTLQQYTGDDMLYISLGTYLDKNTGYVNTDSTRDQFHYFQAVPQYATSSDFTGETITSSTGTTYQPLNGKPSMVPQNNNIDLPRFQILNNHGNVITIVPSNNTGTLTITIEVEFTYYLNQAINLLR